MISREKLLEKLEGLENEVARLREEIDTGKETAQVVSLRGKYAGKARSGAEFSDFEEAKNIWRSGSS